jgi:PAS domain S-box-containing protein
MNSSNASSLFERSIPPVPTVVAELLRCMKDFLERVKSFVESMRAGFGEKEVLDKMIADIEEARLTLGGVLDFLEVQVPIRKRDTIHALIDEVLKKYGNKLEKKGARVFRKFEKDLPEAAVPEGHMIFVLNLLVEYAVLAMSPHGNLWLTAELARTENRGSAATPRYVEITIAFTDHPSLKKGFEIGSAETKVSDLVLLLIKDLVAKSRGEMRLQRNEKERMRSIVLKFPVERRELIYLSLPKPEPAEAKAKPAFHTTYDGRLIRVNSAFAEILGYDSAQQLINCITDVAHQVYVESHRLDELHRLLEKDHVVQRFESKFYRKDGNILWVSQNVRGLYDHKGNLLSYESTVEDFVDQKVREPDALLPDKTQKLSEGITSDLDTILATLIKSSDLLLHRIKPNDPAFSLLKEMRENGVRGAQLLSRLHMTGRGLPPREKKPTVLIVEPEAEVLHQICAFLREAAGYSLLPAGTLEEGRSKAESCVESVDLLIANVAFPGKKSGVYLANELRQKYPKMKAIFLTAYPDDWKDFYGDTTFFVPKPINRTVLIEKVREILGKKDSDK